MSWSGTPAQLAVRSPRQSWLPWAATMLVVLLAAAIVAIVVVAPGDEGEATTGPAPDTTTTTAPSAAYSDTELVETFGDAVWRVEVDGCGTVGTGTAFAIGPHHLVTNAHVVGVDPSPMLRSRSGETTLSGRVIGLSSTPDVAVIEVDAELSPTLEWAATDRLSEGQHMLSLGYPLPATDFSATPGSIVSFQATGDIREAIRTDAALDLGNSGGPALTDDGQVAGVVTLVLLNPEGLQLVPVLFTHDALGSQIDRFVSSPSTIAPDCSSIGNEFPPAPEWYDDRPIPDLEGPPNPPPIETIPLPEPTTTTLPPCPTGAPAATVTEFSVTEFDPEYTPGFYDIVVRGTVTNNASATVSLWGVDVEIVGGDTTAYGSTDAFALRPGESTSFEAYTFVESAAQPQHGAITIDWDWDSFDNYGCGTS